MKIETVMLPTIKGDNTYYIKFTKGLKTEFINVGEKTFTKIKNLLNEPEQTKIPMASDDETSEHRNGGTNPKNRIPK
jgi:hypothetical protein